ncbi:nuclear transport factor 2 family protein [Rhodanobacter sp. Si-c]|uniref:Nuclear transport factor 2 family protein n=1 Tax=Rhodanobacter lycopersici TaxID=3162487 RepID=A0ABV3QCM3_9GAMM
MSDRTYHHVRTSLACAGLLLGAGAVGTQAMAAQQSGTSATDETARTAAAVMAVDQHWLEAEENGDTAWLDGMLLPDYRSVGVAGTFATKAAILAHAAKNRGSQAMKQQVAAWQQAHPVEQQVTLQGDTAILSFVSSAPATKGKLYSSDVFTYIDGRWHALYSAHTELGKS